MIVNIKINSWYDFLRQHIWYNDKVKVGGKSILYKKWMEHGIKFISDLFDSKGNILSELYFTNNSNTFFGILWFSKQYFRI